ncbi:MAG: carbohydrate porin [Acidiferrobacterales bacterium]
MGGGRQPGNIWNTYGQIGLRYDTATRGRFNMSVLGADSSGSEPRLVGDTQGATNLWTPRIVRLYYLNYRQLFGAHLLVRGGLMDANNYFNITGVSAQLINSSFGLVPTLGDISLATAPYSGTGLMGTYRKHGLDAKMGLFQGNPKQLSTAFHDGYTFLGELGSHSHARGPERARTTLKLGGWAYDQPAPLGRKRTSGLYAIGEERWDPVPHHQMGLFLQMGDSRADARPIRAFAGFGLRLKGFMSQHPKDVFALGVAKAWITNAPRPETAYEVTYLIPLVQIRKNLGSRYYLQPDLQYIANPSGGPFHAWVAALRLHIAYF